MSRKIDLTSMSVAELWGLREQLSEILAAKIIAEKSELERRLNALRVTAKHPKAKRHYPPVVPKFANPDDPSQVWAGRGKQPRWVAEKLAAGVDLKDLTVTEKRSTELVGA